MINLKQKLLSNQMTFGSWITLNSSDVVEIIASSKFFNWLVVDMEHSAIDINNAQELIRIIELCGIVPLVRVGENSPNIIKRVMDAGAHGVIVPMVNNKEDAEKAVASVKYPPFGGRGIGLARAQGYGKNFENYKKWVEKESVVIVQIEHLDAINNLEEILNVNGVDGSIIGPYDLSGSIGCLGDFNNPLLLDALKIYEQVCSDIKKPMGIHVVQPDIKQCKYYQEKKYVFIAIGLDTLFLINKMTDVMIEVGDK